MPIEKQAINYSAALFPGKDRDPEAAITIYCKEEYTLTIFFQKERLECNYHAIRDAWVAYAEIDQYSYYIDLLRNEEPIYVAFNIEDRDIVPPDFMVFSRKEPVGEGENPDIEVERLLQHPFQEKPT